MLLVGAFSTTIRVSSSLTQSLYYLFIQMGLDKLRCWLRPLFSIELCVRSSIYIIIYASTGKYMGRAEQSEGHKQAENHYMLTPDYFWYTSQWQKVFLLHQLS